MVQSMGVNFGLNMTDLYSIDLYTTPMQQAIRAKNMVVVAKIIKQAQKFPAVEAEQFFLAALIQAAEDGFAKAVRALIPLCDPKQKQSAPLRWAAMGGHAECVKLLIPVSNPHDENSQALVLAACEGSAECVKLLVKVSNPQDDGSQALIMAAEGGAVECVKLLLKAPNNPTDNAQALVRALKNGFWDVVNEVYPHSDLDAALVSLREWGGDDDKTAWIEDKIVQQQRAVLNTAVKSAGRNRPKGKI